MKNKGKWWQMKVDIIVFQWNTPNDDKNSGKEQCIKNSYNVKLSNKTHQKPLTERQSFIKQPEQLLIILKWFHSKANGISSRSNDKKRNFEAKYAKNIENHQACVYYPSNKQNSFWSFLSNSIATPDENKCHKCLEKTLKSTSPQWIGSKTELCKHKPS